MDETSLLCWRSRLLAFQLDWWFYKVGSSVLPLAFGAEERGSIPMACWILTTEKSLNLGKIIPGLRKRQDHDHDLDIHSSFFMAFMSKAALNTTDCKFIIRLGQSLVSSMVEFWLCVQRNWVQSPEVPSHWYVASTKQSEVDLIPFPWGVQSMHKCYFCLLPWKSKSWVLICAS